MFLTTISSTVCTLNISIKSSRALSSQLLNSLRKYISLSGKIACSKERHLALKEMKCPYREFALPQISYLLRAISTCILIQKLVSFQLDQTNVNYMQTRGQKRQMCAIWCDVRRNMWMTLRHWVNYFHGLVTNFCLASRWARRVTGEFFRWAVMKSDEKSELLCICFLCFLWQTSRIFYFKQQ